MRLFLILKKFDLQVTATIHDSPFYFFKKEMIFFFQGQTGAVFGSSIQTPMIQGHYKEDLT